MRWSRNMARRRCASRAGRSTSISASSSMPRTIPTTASSASMSCRPSPRATTTRFPTTDTGEWIRDQSRRSMREGDGGASGLFQRMEGPRAHGEVLEQQPPPWREAGQTFLPDRGHGARMPLWRVGGRFDYEIQALFSTLADRILRRVAGPGRPGPSDQRRDGQTSASSAPATC